MEKNPEVINKPFSADNESVILANWDIGAEEWKTFSQWELRDRKQAALIMALMILGIGTIILRLTKQAPWGAAIGISLVLGVLVSWLRYRYVIGALAAVVPTHTIFITPYSANFNDKCFLFKDNRKSIKEVRILEHIDPKVLEITYEWSTRYGMTHEELHIPIPKGKLGEAVRLLDSLQPKAS